MAQFKTIQMTRNSSIDRNIASADGDSLAIIKEEQAGLRLPHVGSLKDASKEKLTETGSIGCSCSDCYPTDEDRTYTHLQLQSMLREKEAELNAQFDEELKARLSAMRERFDLVLRNEQLRTCCMLREAHRERKEKVQTLQAQLECKNLTGLMYVLCSERRKSKLEKMKIIQEYTEYIHTLQDILTEGQFLILHLSRGYKTAARVDAEWREKMKAIIKQFQEYVYHFAGGTPDSNQYIFDVPALLKTEAPIRDDPNEDPCSSIVDEQSVTDTCDSVQDADKPWWESFDSENRPFVMFGDLGGVNHNQRRKVILAAKAAKAAPAKWKEYVFKEMFVKSDCPNADTIKDEYPKRVPVDKWVCHDNRASNLTTGTCTDSMAEPRAGQANRQDNHLNSFDTRSMGSILKMVTATNSHYQAPVKTNLLAARDSMEIASSTRMREKRFTHTSPAKNVSICISRQRSPTRYISDEMENEVLGEDGELQDHPTLFESDDAVSGALATNHNDSKHFINAHKPDQDHKINYEKICPMEQCQRMRVDSFMGTLPSYMRASPYTLFEQTFEDYQTCSPEQLEILKQRLDKKKVRVAEEDSMSYDFEMTVDGVGVQTSEDHMDMPPCTCGDVSIAGSSTGNKVFKVADLMPIKQALDEIKKEFFYNQNINFDRFEVVGEKDKLRTESTTEPKNGDFKQLRIEEIKNILKQHPSMLDLFQPNPRC